MVEETSHHVVWADRIGLNKQWARDIESCGKTFGTDAYPALVRRFKNDIPNIKNGPQLKDIIDSYENKDLEEYGVRLLREWEEYYPQEANNDSFVRQKQKEINMHMAEELYKYIIQLLEDQGFAFYKSDTKMGSGKEIEYED